MLRRGALAAFTLSVCVLFGAGAALAYWPAMGTGNTTAAVGTLAAPTNVYVPATSTPNVSVSWTASIGAVTPTGYYVTRITGSTSLPACGSSPAALIATTSCTDTSVPAGTHKYVVTAVRLSWSATSTASGDVSIVSVGQLAFTTQPSSSVTAGTAMTVRVQLQTTALGVPIPTAGVSVTIGFGANPGGGTLSGLLTATTDGTGVATFSGISVIKAGAGYSLVASSGGYSGVVSTSFTVTAAAATQLVVTSPPALSGLASATTNIGPIIVERRDTYGNPATAGSTTITLTAASGGTGIFAAATGVGGPGLTSVNIAAGLASTSFYYGDTKSGSRPFTATGLGSPLTVPVEISAAAATHLRFSPITSPVPKSGFSVTVSILDAFENQTQSAATVTLTSTGQPPTGPQNKCTVVIPTPSHTGSGTFTDLTVNGVKSDCQLTASSTGLSDVSITFNVV
jgi:hypothetical protein